MKITYYLTWMFITNQLLASDYEEYTDEIAIEDEQEQEQKIEKPAKKPGMSKIQKLY